MLPRSIQRIQRVATRPIQRVTIKQLVARSASQLEQDHIDHAIWVREQEVVRLAHRLNNWLELPYVVFTNNRFHEVFRLFQNAFQTLADQGEITNMKDVEEFAEVLRGAYSDHSEVINYLQEGYGELQALLDNIDLEAFLDQTFKTRIGNRVLAEHFLALHDARMSGQQGCTGVVHPECCPAEMVKELAESLGNVCYDVYGARPRIVLEGQLETRISFIYDHLHFMLQEILKNAMRATVETHLDDVFNGLPPVTVEIMKGSFDVTLKISDRGGGIRADDLKHIWRYGYTSAGDYSAHGGGLLSGAIGGPVGVSRRAIAGYGFGLPLSLCYAQYFGGDIIIQSMHGYGSDVYLNVNHLGDTHEARE
mmetsp:Transcript_2897/g.4709  ORF Transcript_2897/g.4709 Transcript_2897/m.4709 type:complete len:365 (-) Transcript_2897:58-1152(-)